MLEIQYREIKNKGIEILRCFGKDSSVRLPDEINGKPVLKIGDYAFSGYKRKEDEAETIRIGEDLFEEKNPEMICGPKVEEVYLPVHVEEIGRYAFYGCVNLRLLGFSDSLLRTGTGIFTGCKLREIRLDLYHGEKTALKDVAGDTRFPVTVRIRDHQDGHEASLFFPEYYEESVENTPARIVELHFHGTGYQYRQCFFQGKLDYEKYDALFSVASVQEDPEIAWEIALGRVLYPYRLTEEHRNEYLDYMRENLNEILDRLLAEENVRAFYMFAEEDVWTRETMEAAIDRAAARNKTEILSLLMDEQNRRFPKKKKIFDL